MISAVISPEAAADLLQIANYLDESALSMTHGVAFLRAAATLTAHLESFPESGRRRSSDDRRLQGIRSLGFDTPYSKYILFYRFDRQSLLIVRVLHGARNLETVLGVVP